jgi:hypothetical protein
VNSSETLTKFSRKHGIVLWYRSTYVTSAPQFQIQMRFEVLQPFGICAPAAVSLCKDEAQSGALQSVLMIPFATVHAFSFKLRPSATNTS